jgi:DNA-binding GntR family transcriptional regulator
MVRVVKANAEKSRRLGRPKGTGSQRAYETLRRRILRLELPPGADIDEKALVQELRISRTPVREALIRLSTDGLVHVQPNRGARVSPLDIHEIPELLEALELCMRLTTRWAALRRSADDLAAMRVHCQSWAKAAKALDFHGMSEANNRFHMAIAQASGNRHLAGMYRGLLPGFLRLTHALLSAAPMQSKQYRAYFNRVDAEHRRIIDVVASGDAEAADALGREHADLMRERVAGYFNSPIARATPLADPPPRPGAAPRGA